MVLTASGIIVRGCIVLAVTLVAAALVGCDGRTQGSGPKRHISNGSIGIDVDLNLGYVLQHCQDEAGEMVVCGLILWKAAPGTVPVTVVLPENHVRIEGHRLPAQKVVYALTPQKTLEPLDLSAEEVAEVALMLQSAGWETLSNSTVWKTRLRESIHYIPAHRD
ncbi:MAG: hypothetical protein WD294_00385 [Phycisphaeraceae bacterium]